MINKYAPKTAPSYIQLKKDFANSRLKSADSNPEEWLTELESLRSEMNRVTIAGKSDMTDVDLIIHILSNLPEEYEVAVSKLEEKLKDTNTPLALEDVRTELSSRHERIMKHHDDSNDEKALLSGLGLEDIDEKALAAFIKQFKGTCNKCGKYGHKSADCKSNSSSNENGRTDKFTGRCNYCGKIGHKIKDCRVLKAKEAEKGKVAIDESESESDDDSYAELGFAVRSKKKVRFNLEGNSSKKKKRLNKKKQKKTTSKSKVESILKGEKGLKCTIDGHVYPSFTKTTWFGDTGASCHITNDDSDMYDVELIDEEIGGIGPTSIRATKKGKKKCLITQNDGTVTEKVLYPCKYAEDASDSLLSITSELSRGAQLSKDERNNIKLTYPDGKEFYFDRRLKTRDGWVAGVDIVSPQQDETAKGETVKRLKTENWDIQVKQPLEQRVRLAV